MLENGERIKMELTSEGIWNSEYKRTEDFRKYAGDIFTEEAVQRLAEWGYFRAPASRKHHGAFEGGLYFHSKSVAMLLEEFTEHERLVWKRKESPRIIGLFHDLCKTDSSSGTGMLPGHGEKSAILAQEILSLTEEEILCIRFHMGAFEGQEIWGYLQKAASRCPGILWTMQADLLASWVLDT